MNLQSPFQGSGTAVSCPKCGFEQEGDVECLRCGIIFAKYKPSVDSQEEVPPPRTTTPEPVEPGLISRIVRILPWISLAAAATLLFLILKQAPPFAVQTDPEAAERVAEKMAQLQLAMQSNQRHSARLNEAELNQWIRENMAIAATHEAREAGIPVPAGHEASITEVQSALKDIRMSLTGNQACLHPLRHVQKRSVSAIGRHIGNTRRVHSIEADIWENRLLPIPSFTLDRVVHELFDSPQHRENFQLPPEVESVSIENSTLVIATR